MVPVILNRMSANPAANPPRRALSAILGTALVFLAPVVFAVAADLPGALRWAWPSWIVMVAALVLSFHAFVGDRRIWVRSISGVNTALFALGLYAFLFLTRLPSASAPAANSIVPDFALPDQNGVVVRLSEACASGPVFLGFYRGRW